MWVPCRFDVICKKSVISCWSRMNREEIFVDWCLFFAFCWLFCEDFPTLVDDGHLCLQGHDLRLDPRIDNDQDQNLEQLPWEFGWIFAIYFQQQSHKHTILVPFSLIFSKSFKIYSDDVQICQDLLKQHQRFLKSLAARFFAAISIPSALHEVDWCEWQSHSEAVGGARKVAKFGEVVHLQKSVPLPQIPSWVRQDDGINAAHLEFVESWKIAVAPTKRLFPDVC